MSHAPSARSEPRPERPDARAPRRAARTHLVLDFDGESAMHLRTSVVAHHGPRRARRGGFSLAELMVVIVILGLLATIVVPNVFSYLSKANTTVAKNDIAQIATAIDNWMVNNAGRPPESLDQLTALDEDGNSYLKNIPLDPWKNPYVYEPPGGGRAYRVVSYGKDGQPGGEGDAADIDNITMLEK